MDIKEKQLTNFIKEEPIDSSLIRTMVKDMANLKGEHLPVPNAAPPVNLPIPSSSKIKKIKVKRPNVFYRLFKSKSVDIKDKTIPKPLVPPTPPKPKPSEIETTKKQIKRTFVFLSLAIMVIITSIGGFFYWWNYVRPPVQIPPVTPPVIDIPVLIEPDEPQSLIPVAATETIELIAGQENLLTGQLKVLAAQEQENNSFKRVLVKIDTEYADLNTLMFALGISIPESIILTTTGDYTLFFYSQAEGNRLGLVVKMGESETLVQDLKIWETTALNDLKSMILVDEVPVPATEGFQDNTHNDVYIRYMNFNTPDLSLDYGLVPGNLVLSTSRESMFATINALLAE